MAQAFVKSSEAVAKLNLLRQLDEDLAADRPWLDLLDRLYLQPGWDAAESAWFQALDPLRQEEVMKLVSRCEAAQALRDLVVAYSSVSVTLFFLLKILMNT